MGKDRPKHKSLEHGSTVIVCNDSSELFYVLKWCERVGKDVSGWMYDRSEFPFCISVHGQIVGWTDLMDRALYYKSFEEYVNDTKAQQVIFGTCRISRKQIALQP